MKAQLSAEETGKKRVWYLTTYHRTLLVTALPWDKKCQRVYSCRRMFKTVTEIKSKTDTFKWFYSLLSQYSHCSHAALLGFALPHRPASVCPARGSFTPSKTAPHLVISDHRAATLIGKGSSGTVTDRAEWGSVWGWWIVTENNFESFQGKLKAAVRYVFCIEHFCSQFLKGYLSSLWSSTSQRFQSLCRCVHGSQF